MNNKLVRNTVISDNISDTNTVTPFLRNSHCIICGKPFDTVRMGKLYCSAKCKQFAYHHKEEIFQPENIAGIGINAKPQTFYLNEFQFYDKRQKSLKRYNELKNKKAQWELFTSPGLTKKEISELDELENELENEIKSLNLKELSIEQLSFIKSLNPSIEGISFCELVASFSKGFFSQLNLSPPDQYSNTNVNIKNKFINHCNLIAVGVIKFVKRPINDRNEN